MAGLLAAFLLAVAALAGVCLLTAQADRTGIPELTPAKGYPPEQLPGTEVGELVLPDLSAPLFLGGAGIDRPARRNRGIPRITVLVTRTGLTRLERLDFVEAWRGVNLPKDIGPAVTSPLMKPSRDMTLTVRCAAEAPGYRIELAGTPVGDLRALDDALAASAQRVFAFGADPEAPFGPIAGILALLAKRGRSVEFRLPDRGKLPAATDVALRGELARRATETQDQDGLPTAGVRIRADARAPWRAVHATVACCADARIYRVSFGALMEGADVSIGRTGGLNAREAGPGHIYAPLETASGE